MEPHLIELPRRILVGRDVVYKIPELCIGTGISGNSLILTGENTLKIAGESVIQNLKNLESQKNPRLTLVKEGSLREAERIKDIAKDIDFIVSVGGGKIIDIGKLVAYELKIPFISVPTAPSHDGIASERVSIKNGNGKHSQRAKPPIIIVADIRILSRAPYRLISAGAADVISNLTAIHDWKLGRDHGEYYSEYAASLALMSSEIVMKSAKLIKDVEERGIRNLVEALISSGISMSLVGTSRPASGAEHAFSHALDSLGNSAPHGEKCGLGSIIMAYLQGQDWERIRDSLKQIGAPTTAEEIGASQEMIVEALIKAKDLRDRYTILNKNPLDKEKALKVCKEAGVF